MRYPITWPEREMFGILALIPIGGAIAHSWQQSGVPLLPMIAGAISGLALAIVVLIGTNRTASWLQKEIHQPFPRTFVARWLRRLMLWIAMRPNIREGFIDRRTQMLRPGHIVAWGCVHGVGDVLSGVSASATACTSGTQRVDARLCAAARADAVLDSRRHHVLVDRYRLPMMTVVLAVPFLTAWLPWSDHFYRTLPREDLASPMPQQVLELGADTPIVIAATGGGIHASAWAARVLTGIAQSLPPELQEKYARSIRLISTVLGRRRRRDVISREGPRIDGVFDANNLDEVVANAEASSLDDVAWGAAYPTSCACSCRCRSGGRASTAGRRSSGRGRETPT